jgi:hypothetical protein
MIFRFIGISPQNSFSYKNDIFSQIWEYYTGGVWKKQEKNGFIWLNGGWPGFVIKLPTSLALRRTSRRASAGDIDGDGGLTVLDIDYIIA